MQPRTHNVPIRTQLTYYAFGDVRESDGQGARTGYIGREVDSGSDLGAYGVRHYESAIGRFLSTDVLWEKYTSWNPYHYCMDNPLKFIDNTGFGAAERVATARSFLTETAGTKYLWESGPLRTEKTEEALANMDCSELVCRVLEADGLTSTVKSMNTAALKTEFSKVDKWEVDDKPQVGDIFLRRDDEGGHTGVVTEVSKDGKVSYAHASTAKNLSLIHI